MNPEQQIREDPSEPLRMWAVVNRKGEIVECHWTPDEARDDAAFQDVYGMYAPYRVVEMVEVGK